MQMHISNYSSRSVSLISGMGDMAVSNSIGSNIFDVLLGLGFPWALRTLIVSYGSMVNLGVFSSLFFSPSSIVASSVNTLKLLVVWFEGDNQQQRPGVLCDPAVGLCHAHGG